MSPIYSKFYTDNSKIYGKQLLFFIAEANRNVKFYFYEMLIIAIQKLYIFQYCLFLCKEHCLLTLQRLYNPLETSLFGIVKTTDYKYRKEKWT